MAEEKKKKKKKKINKRTGLFDRLREIGRNISSTLTAPQRRVAKEKMGREPTKSETVGDAQKMRTRTKTSMADAQKMRTRTKTDMADTQKRPAKAQDTMPETQKRGAVRKGVKTVSDERKPFQTYKNRDDVAKMFDRAKRKAGSSNKTTVSDAQKSGTTPSSGTSKEPSTFKEAFRMARKEGKAKFTYKGKSYAAVTMDEVKKAKKQGKIEKATLTAYLNMMKKRKK